MDGPAKFRESLLDIGQGIGEGSSSMRAGGALGEDAFALQDQRLPFAYLFGVARVRDGRVQPGWSGLRFRIFF